MCCIALWIGVVTPGLSLARSVFSVDYNDDLDTLVSGSADFSVKVWALSAGACLNTLTGHTEWVTKVNPTNMSLNYIQDRCRWF